MTLTKQEADHISNLCLPVNIGACVQYALWQRCLIVVLKALSCLFCPVVCGRGIALADLKLAGTMQHISDTLTLLSIVGPKTEQDFWKD